MNKEKLEQMAEEYVQKNYPLESVKDFEKTMVLQTVASKAFIDALSIPEVKAMREALECAQKMNNHLFDTKLKPVNWGNTFVDWGIINSSMIAVDKALADLEGVVK